MDRDGRAGGRFTILQLETQKMLMEMMKTFVEHVNPSDGEMGDNGEKKPGAE